MSRIGKKPVAVPAGVTAAVDGNLVKVKGAKGELTFLVPDNVAVANWKTEAIGVKISRAVTIRSRLAPPGACRATHDRQPRRRA